MSGGAAGQSGAGIPFPPPGPDIPAWDIDPYAPDVLCDPEPYYTELRARGPLVWLSRHGIFAAGRHGEVQEIFSDWERFVSSRGVGLTDFKTEKPWRAPSIVLEVDPPAHTRTRAVITRALSPRAVGRLKAEFQREADALVDRLLARGGVLDAVPDLAEAYPLKVFPDAVGIAGGEREMLLVYGAMVFNALGPDNEIRRRALSRAAEVTAWIASRCRREGIAERGFAATIYAAADAGEISEEEAGLLVRSMLSAGVDTTVNGLAGALWCLSRNPDQYAPLRADPALARPCFEEVLRRTSPVHSFCRTANQDTMVSGIPIPEGSKILCVLAAANLDPVHWPDADRFDIHRRPVGHVAFGTGIHGCVGQAVARQEAEAVLSAIARKVAAIEPAGTAVWRPNNAARGLESLPLRFLPA